jgi:dienelactone hydrolase
MRTESLEDSYLALPDGAGPHPGVVVIHEASGLNDHIRDICRRFAEQGYAALGVDHFGVPALKAALGRLADHHEVDAGRMGAIGFRLGGSIVLTWGCTQNRLKAIAPYYGAAPKPREAIRRPVVALNHAVAVAMVRGTREGLELLGKLEADERIAEDHRLHAVRAHLLKIAGDRVGARESHQAAARRTTSFPQQRYLHAQAARLTDDH